MTTLQDLYNTRVQRGELDSDPAQVAALIELERIRAALAAPVRKGLFRKAPPPPQGLYLWGGVGRGKSMLMDMFVEASPVPARRVHFHAFMQEVHSGMHVARQNGEEDALRPVAEALAASVRLFAFDEMQITDITDAMIVGRLFEFLFKAGVVVVTTSNRVPDDLYKNGLNRQLFLPFIDILKGQMVVAELISPRDYRQDRIAGSEVYFAPADDAARREINSIWTDLTDGKAGPLDITIKGRTLTLPQFHNGMARATFFQLCGVMLGPADYLAIADVVRVLVLEDIPRLGRSNFNEAKRFVTLIDALYEARVRLVCSAAALPEMLYIEGEGSFEFERTASRLREMQAADWALDSAP